MDEKMLKALREELESFKNNLPTYATPDDLDNKFKSIEDKIDGLSAEDGELTKLRTDLEEVGTKVQQIKDGQGGESKVKPLKAQLEEKAGRLKELAENRQGKVSFAIEKTDVTRASVTNHTLAFRLPDVGELPYPATVLEPLFNSGSVGANSNGAIRYVDQAAVTRSADWTAEAAVKPESAITWEEHLLPIEKVADTIPVTMEALNDVDFIESEIRNFLLNNLRLKIDAALYTGNGTSPIIKGLFNSYAQAFVAPQAGITEPNMYDLIIKMAEQVSTGTPYMANYALVNPADYTNMLLTKLTDGQYTVPPFAQMSQDGKSIVVNGITVIQSNSVTANTCVVGDFNYGTVYSLGGVTVDVGWIDKQFVENMVTLRAERRLALLVRNAHLGAFVKSTDVAADIATLGTTPP